MGLTWIFFKNVCGNTLNPKLPPFFLRYCDTCTWWLSHHCAEKWLLHPIRTGCDSGPVSKARGGGFPSCRKLSCVWYVAWPVDLVAHIVIVWQKKMIPVFISILKAELCILVSLTVAHTPATEPDPSSDPGVIKTPW